MSPRFLKVFPRWFVFHKSLPTACLLDYNVIATSDEVETNCLRAIVSKVFGIDYDDVNKKALTKKCMTDDLMK